MLVYCAEVSNMDELFDTYKKELDKIRLNILTSYMYHLTNKNRAKIFLKHGTNVLIDSGAFTFQKTGLEDLEGYVKKYKKFIKKYDDKVNGFFELDIDNVIGYKKVYSIRKDLETVSDKIIPVWHKSLGVKEFINMCNDYDYVSVSCVGDRDILPHQYKYFVDHAHKKDCKIHGLGMTKRKIIDKVPFDTVDSTSWFKSPRFARIKNSLVSHKTEKLNSQYTSDNRKELMYIEFMEHLRFQKEYYDKWKWYHDD